MGRSTVTTIINELCEAVCEELRMIYLSSPDKHEWKHIAEDFNNMWTFPYCVGAALCVHIILKLLLNLSYTFSSFFAIRNVSIT